MPKDTLSYTDLKLLRRFLGQAHTSLETFDGYADHCGLDKEHPVRQKVHALAEAVLYEVDLDELEDLDA